MNIKNTRLKELVVYFVVGVSTTVVNIASYHLLVFLGIDYKIANLLALFLCKVYGYFANKTIVFHSKCDSFGELLKEIIKYIGSRGFTGIVDYFGLIFAVEILGLDKIYSKYAIEIIVFILNYILGKFFVFKKSNGGQEDVL